MPTDQPLDTGDVADVDKEKQLDHDEPEPNEDVDDPLDDIDEGQVIDMENEGGPSVDDGAAPGVRE